MKKEIMEFKSTHGLDFEIAPFVIPDYLKTPENFQRFRIGTCTGLWGDSPTSYIILAVSNAEPGNGHLQDVFDWFEMSCKRDGRTLQIAEVWNNRFMTHLIQKRSFEPISATWVEKKF